MYNDIKYECVICITEGKKTLRNCSIILVQIKWDFFFLDLDKLRAVFFGYVTKFDMKNCLFQK